MAAAPYNGTISDTQESSEDTRSRCGWQRGARPAAWTEARDTEAGGLCRADWQTVQTRARARPPPLCPAQSPPPCPQLQKVLLLGSSPEAGTAEWAECDRPAAGTWEPRSVPGPCTQPRHQPHLLPLGTWWHSWKGALLRPELRTKSTELLSPGAHTAAGGHFCARRLQKAVTAGPGTRQHQARAVPRRALAAGPLDPGPPATGRTCQTGAREASGGNTARAVARPREAATGAGRAGVAADRCSPVPSPTPAPQALSPP